MKTHHLLKSLCFLAFSILFSLGNLTAQKPATPKNLKADTVIGHQVSLSWENPDAGVELLSTGFETLLPTDTVSLEVEGWTVKKHNTSSYSCSWFNYPSTEFIENASENYDILIHHGKRSAAIFPDMMEDGHDLHQDEWLISPIMPQAAYVQFSHYTTPEIVEDGIHPEYPDHYVVIASTDGGETWSEPLWDARYDALPEGGWQTVTLALTDKPTDNMRVAFRAYGEYQVDENNDTINQSLYGAWAIDDVIVFPSTLSVIDHYEITLDGEPLAENRNVSFTDKSAKTAGEHTYGVYSVTADGVKSDPATVKVNLEELVFAAPRNFTCTPKLDNATGKYTVTMTWDAPESEFQPVSYTIYNGKLLFGADLTDKNGKEGVGMSGCFGIYQFSIVALYESPDGESDPVVRNLAMGVRFGVNDLQAEIAGEDVALTWQAPYESEYEMDSYTVYRSGEKIAEGVKELNYRDKAVPDGLYQYTVIAVYKDKQESVKASVSLQVGEPVRVSMPYSQSFATAFLPANWQIVNQSQRTPDKYIWYFDDRSRLGIKGEGFEGCYAAIDCNDAPFYTRDATLELPAIDLTSVQDRSSITFSFYYSYAVGGKCDAGTEYSVDGKNWIILEIIDKETGFTPSEDGDFHIQQASYCFGDNDALMAMVDTAQTLYLRFHYSGSMSKFFAIDNVVVTADGMASNQTAETENVNINISAYNGLINIDAPQAFIRNVEVFSMQGMKLLERKGKGESFMSLPASQRGPAIVRVTTNKGVRVVKLFL